MMEMEYGDERNIKLKDAIAICKKRGVPFLLDCAPMCPPFDRLKFLASLGADMFLCKRRQGLVWTAMQRGAIRQKRSDRSRDAKRIAV